MAKRKKRKVKNFNPETCRISYHAQKQMCARLALDPLEVISKMRDIILQGEPISEEEMREQFPTEILGIDNHTEFYKSGEYYFPVRDNTVLTFKTSNDGDICGQLNYYLKQNGKLIDRYKDQKLKDMKEKYFQEEE